MKLATRPRNIPIGATKAIISSKKKVGMFFFFYDGDRGSQATASMKMHKERNYAKTCKNLQRTLPTDAAPRKIKSYEQIAVRNYELWGVG